MDFLVCTRQYSRSLYAFSAWARTRSLNWFGESPGRANPCMAVAAASAAPIMDSAGTAGGRAFGLVILMSLEVLFSGCAAMFA